jgi:hypothetical protein
VENVREERIHCMVSCEIFLKEEELIYVIEDSVEE